MKEKKISKKKLVELSGIFVYDYRKMRENKDVETSVLRKIALAFHIKIEEMVNFMLY